jgi:hypothetical protein
MLRGKIPFALLAFRDFLTIDGNIPGRLDADANLRAVHRHHGHFDIVAYAQTFTGAAGKYQHETLRVYGIRLAHAGSSHAVSVPLQIPVGIR